MSPSFSEAVAAEKLPIIKGRLQVSLQKATIIDAAVIETDQKLVTAICTEATVSISSTKNHPC